MQNSYVELLMKSVGCLCTVHTNNCRIAYVVEKAEFSLDLWKSELSHGSLLQQQAENNANSFES